MRDGQNLNYRTIHLNKFKRLGQARVQDDAQLEKALGKKLYEAHCELSHAFMLELGGHGYPHEASFIEKIPATGNYEYSIWAADRLELFNKWRNELPHRLHRAICFDICFRGCTVKQCAFERSMGRKTVRKYLREALNEWSRLRGWGEQLKKSPPRQKKKKKYKKPRKMIDLKNPDIRIIIYENE